MDINATRIASYNMQNAKPQHNQLLKRGAEEPEQDD